MLNISRGVLYAITSKMHDFLNIFNNETSYKIKLKVFAQ